MKRKNPELAKLIGERIRKARIAKNLSQYGLSLKAGIGQVQISTYETGKIMPGIWPLKQIADALNVSYEYLIEGEEKAEQRAEIKELKAELAELQNQYNQALADLATNNAVIENQNDLIAMLKEKQGIPPEVHDYDSILKNLEKQQDDIAY